MSNAPFRSRVLALAVGTATTFASGCIPALPAGGAREPSHDVPESYGEAAAEVPSQTADAAAPAAQRSDAVLIDWREFFTDEKLVALIDEALRNNQELNITIQETLVANSEVIARRGDLLPNLGFGANVGIDRVGDYTSQGRADEANGVPSNLPNFALGLYASWEIDIWGRLRNLRDAATQRFLASVEGQNFMVTRLVAEIASLYYELIALDRQLAVLDDNIVLQESSLGAVRLEFEAARVTAVAVSRFSAELRAYQSRRYETLQRRVETENQLNFLLGRFPQHIDRTTDDFMALEPATLRAGLPAELLANRPDIRRAELELEAARLDVRAARARFYPSLSLEAGLGYESFDITKLFATPSSILYSLAASLTAPLLNRANLTAQYFGADARQMQSVFKYERAIRSAFMEVANRLSLLDNLARSYALRSEQVGHLQQSIEQSTLLFRSARADYLEVLTARRDALEAQLELIETKKRQLSAAVGLYQALGGGWRRARPPQEPVQENEDGANP